MRLCCNRGWYPGLGGGSGLGTKLCCNWGWYPGLGGEWPGDEAML